jgi:hypothetical protein
MTTVQPFVGQFVRKRDCVGGQRRISTTFSNSHLLQPQVSVAFPFATFYIKTIIFIVFEIQLKKKTDKFVYINPV